VIGIISFFIAVPTGGAYVNAVTVGGVFGGITMGAIFGSAAGGVLGATSGRIREKATLGPLPPRAYAASVEKIRREYLA
jgi:hypothetical protein